jgi:hypothetical protein
MFANRHNLLAFAMALVAAFAFVGVAEAGWVSVKNDSTKAVVVQEVVIVNGKQVRGKPTKLLAGDSFREFQNTPGIKNYEVYDAGNPATPVWTGSLDCKADSQSFSITTLNGRYGVVKVPEPKKP